MFKRAPNSDVLFYQNVSKAILGPDDEPVQELLGPYAHRIDAHRGNFLMGAQNAVISAYPVVERLVGEEYMQALAQAFVKRSPPKLSTLTLYANEFPEFLRGFAPVQKHLPWLSAVAELDLAWFEVYAAANENKLEAKKLDEYSSGDLPLLSPGLIPAAKLLRFKIPAYSIWRTNKVDEKVQAVDIKKGAEWALVWRDNNQISHTLLSRAEYVFLNNIDDGLSFAHAYAKCVRYDQGFDLQQQFSRWLSAGLFKEVMK